MSSLGKTGLKKRCGPLCSTLDAVLNKNKITPQAYHGRSFIGNHYYKYLKTDVHKQLARQTGNYTEIFNQNIRDHTFVSKKKLDSINITISKMHKLILTTALMRDDRVAKIENKIEQYLKLYHGEL